MKRGTPQWRASVAAGAHGVRPHPFVREVLKRHGTVRAWAAIHCGTCGKSRAWHAYVAQDHAYRPLPLATASSWTAKGSKKTIPRRWADLIASEFVDEKSGKSLVPATRKTWPNGIL